MITITTTSRTNSPTFCAPAPPPSVVQPPGICALTSGCLPHASILSHWPLSFPWLRSQLNSYALSSALKRPLSLSCSVLPTLSVCLSPSRKPEQQRELVPRLFFHEPAPPFAYRISLYILHGASKSDLGYFLPPNSPPNKDPPNLPHFSLIFSLSPPTYHTLLIE